jgi:hypothetical protein
MDKETVSLENLGMGACMEMFEDGWKTLLANVLDPNTPAKAARSFSLKITIKPNDERDRGVVKIEPKTTLAPVNPFATKVFIGLEAGKPAAREYNDQQEPLPGMERKVFTLNKKED